MSDKPIQSDSPIQTLPKTPEIDFLISGAIFDFMGFLSSRATTVTIGGSNNVVVLIEVFEDWARRRHLQAENALVTDWTWKRRYFVLQQPPTEREPPSTTPEPEEAPASTEGPETQADDTFRGRARRELAQLWKEAKETIGCLAVGAVVAFSIVTLVGAFFAAIDRFADLLVEVIKGAIRFFGYA